MCRGDTWQLHVQSTVQEKVSHRTTWQDISISPCVRALGGRCHSGFLHLQWGLRMLGNVALRSKRAPAQRLTAAALRHTLPMQAVWPRSEQGQLRSSYPCHISPAVLIPTLQHKFRHWRPDLARRVVPSLGKKLPRSCNANCIIGHCRPPSGVT